MFKKLFGSKKNKSTSSSKENRLPHYRLTKENLLPPNQMFTDQPDGIRDYLLRDLSVQLTGHSGYNKLANRYDAAAEAISSRHLDRNLRGRELEEKAKTTPKALDEAIQNYQANIAEMFIGDHPYRRLRIIFTRQKRYKEAISVCDAYIRMANKFIELGIHEPGELLCQEYTKWKEKLLIKQEKLLSKGL